MSGDLGELMRQLAERRHGEVSFVEQHFLKLLKRPAESYGELTYDAPDRLEKRTIEPKPETLTLAGDVLTVVRGGRTRTLDLKAYPALVPFIESIRATLAGDLPRSSGCSRSTSRARSRAGGSRSRRATRKSRRRCRRCASTASTTRSPRSRYSRPMATARS